MKIIDASEQNKIEQTKMPEWINPMLATLTHDYFDKTDWIYERKLDGERCIVYNNGDDIKLMSRNKKQLNEHYPEIVKALKKEKLKNYIIDGEIVAFNGKVTDFSKLQGRMHLNNKDEVEKNQVDVYYYIFDILYIEGNDVRKCSLKTRKKILKNIFHFNSPLFYTKYIQEKGIHYLKRACDKGWEGLIAKDYDGQYVSTRSPKMA